MPSIALPFATPWEVVIPIVTRYMDEEFVEAFFADGSLRLSTFDYFRTHPDERRRDGAEGFPAVEARSPNSEGVYLGVLTQECFVLCGTTIESEESAAAFGTKSAIRILDVPLFAQSIGRHIPGFVAGMQGACRYNSNTAHQVFTPEEFRPPLPDEDKEEWGKRLHARASRGAHESLFVKDVSFAKQAEYRVIWFTTKPKGLKQLDIHCPEARDFCQRLPMKTDVGQVTFITPVDPKGHE